MYTAAVCQLYQ